jgi:glyoxylase-like metal-dependent hydrolase (beta-lactamase superfamily II)
VLVEVAEGVLVRQSTFCQSNAIVVIGRDGVLLIDPGVDGHDLQALSDDLVRLGLPVAAGFATHPHWDHLLWHAEFGAVPRYGTEKCVVTARAHALDARAKAQRLAPGAPIELIGSLTPLALGAAVVPWDGPDVRIVEHDAHAPGHAALVIAHANVVVAGDMLSDVEVPLLDLRSRDPLGDYAIGVDRIAAFLNSPDVTLIPGHGSIACGDQAQARVLADRDYLEDLRSGRATTDLRLDPSATYGPDWLPREHELQRQAVQP